MNPETKTSSKKTLLIWLVFLICIIGLSGVCYYYYSQYNLLKNSPDEVTKIENKKLTDQVEKLIILPSGEIPVVQTIIDKNKLKDQAFFANAENGDKMLIYSLAKKAILYRPSAKKIVEIFTNITINNPSPTTAPTPAIPEGPTTPPLP
jgi:hypothetical protein